jgi:hypothetical protein
MFCPHTLLLEYTERHHFVVAAGTTGLYMVVELHKAQSYKPICRWHPTHIFQNAGVTPRCYVYFEMPTPQVLVVQEPINMEMG